jgi:hypothetical protein
MYALCAYIYIYIYIYDTKKYTYIYVHVYIYMHFYVLNCKVITNTAQGKVLKARKTIKPTLCLDPWVDHESEHLESTQYQ